MARSISKAIEKWPSTVTVAREAPGLFVLGRWTPGATTSSSHTASVQPAKGRDMLRLPEGLRTSRTIAVYSQTELRTASAAGQYGADKVTHNGTVYEVQMVEDWSDHGGYYKALCVETGQG